jgi:hypothetical protein
VLSRPAIGEEARASLFDYLEVFYNRQRRHSTIKYERLHWSSKHPQPPNRHVSAERGQDRFRHSSAKPEEPQIVSSRFRRQATGE